MQIQDDLIKKLVLDAFKISIEDENIGDNRKKSSYFVSNLANVFLEKNPGKEALVQHPGEGEKKTSGEWLLDIAIVSKCNIETIYQNRKSSMVKRIHWAIESEFDTSLKEFGRDFAKLLHIKSEAYLYINGVDQIAPHIRNEYIKAQTKLAKELVAEEKIDKPFYLAFVPTPGLVFFPKKAKKVSLWTEGFGELNPWIKVFNISSDIKNKQP